MPNGRCRMHGEPSPGAPKENKTHSSTAVIRQKPSSGDVKYPALIRAGLALAGKAEV
jgi:hypothetical protein